MEAYLSNLTVFNHPLIKHKVSHLCDVNTGTKEFSELVKELAGGTHVDVEHVNVGVRVLLADEHRVLCGVHTADLGAITLSPAVVAARTDALNKHDGVRVGLVGGTEKRSAVRTCRVHKSFKLKGGDNVLALGISIFLVSVELYRVEAGRNNDRAVFFLNKCVLLLVIDSTRSAYLCADSALAVPQHIAVIGIDDRNLRHCLGKRNVDSAAVVKPEVESVRHLLLRALFGAEAAAGTLRLVDEAGLAADLDVEVADKAADEKYGDFLLRSAAFVLKNRGRDITASFTDDRLIEIGFTAAENGGMKADSWKLNLDKCGGCK